MDDFQGWTVKGVASLVAIEDSARAVWLLLSIQSNACIRNRGMTEATQTAPEHRGSACLGLVVKTET